MIPEVDYDPDEFDDEDLGPGEYQAREARRRGHELAKLAAADQAWNKEATEKLEAYLREYQVFFVDEFWERTKLRKPREARALGAIILGAKKKGWIVPTGSSKPSVRSHGGHKPIWRSTIWDPKRRNA